MRAVACADGEAPSPSLPGVLDPDPATGGCGGRGGFGADALAAARAEAASHLAVWSCDAVAYHARQYTSTPPPGESRPPAVTGLPPTQVFMQLATGGEVVLTVVQQRLHLVQLTTTTCRQCVTTTRSRRASA